MQLGILSASGPPTEAATPNLENLPGQPCLEAGRHWTFFFRPVRTRILLVRVVLEHHRPRVIQFNATGSPTATWITQQIIEAFPLESAPKYLGGDTHRIYGAEFTRKIKSMGMNAVVCAPSNPWKNHKF